MTRWQKLKVLMAFATPSILIGVILGLYPGYQLYRHVWYDASFCHSCHVHDYANVGWSASIHGDKTTCHDCHHQRFRDYIKEAVIMVAKHPKFPKDLHHTPYVKEELCAACHIKNAADRSTITGPMRFEDVEKIPKVDLSHMHAVHLSKETDFTLLNALQLSKNETDITQLAANKELPRTRGVKRAITCVDCHGGPSNRGHNFSAVDVSCVRCHETPHKGQVGQQFGCRSCHFQEFMIPPEKLGNSIQPKTK